MSVTCRRIAARWAGRLLGLALLVGCAAEIQVEDDGDARRSDGAGSSTEDVGGGGSGGAVANGTGTNGAGASGAPSDAEAVADARAACTDYYYSCNGIDSLMSVTLESCSDVSILAECAPHFATLYRCATRPNGSRYDSCDTELENRCLGELRPAVAACMNPHFCGYGEPPECATADNGCSCAEGCEDGHVARMDCVATEPRGDACDCYFDGELVGACDNGYDSSCLVRRSCCEALMR